MADDSSPGAEPAERIALAEEIIRALQETRTAMYNSSLEALWPTRHLDLVREYRQRYGVDLG